MSTSNLMSLPVDIPWKLVAVSPDMMDTKFCNKLFPFTWRSSLAIYAFEPNVEQLPVEFCEDRITYLKVTCNITGYQPSKEETQRGYASFPTIPSEDMHRILKDYFACYGVLLNVAVFPHFDDDVILKNYPHIVDFEPKRRDLYQAATENGEILTASVSGVKTNKTFVHTESTETGLELNAKYKLGNAEFGGKLAHKWGETDQDSRTVQAESSRERREKEGINTNISQMYNILTGYHVGTNRATFLMLPRPHTLQPTEHRTFVQGLRVIEGVQEFFLVIVRPKNMERFCVEALLETGHFPEKVDIEEPKEEDIPGTPETFWVIKDGPWGVGGSDRVKIDTQHIIKDGWIIDREKGDPGHPGIKMVEDLSNKRAKESLQDYNYKAITDNTVEVVGTIEGYSWFFDGTDAHFRRRYEVYIKKQKPKSPNTLPKVTSKFLMTARALCACLKSVEKGVESISPYPEYVAQPLGEWIVDEQIIEIAPQPTVSKIGVPLELPFPKEVIRQTHYAMTTSWRLPSRYPFGEVGFLESDFFKDQIRQLMPDDLLNTTLSKIEDIPQEVIKSFGDDCTVGDVLKMNFTGFVSKTGLSIKKSIQIRNSMLTIKPTKK